VDVKADKVLDCTGLLCPMPVVKTKKAMNDLEVGQVLDPGSIPDMEAWAKQTQHELLVAEELDGGKFRFLIRKTH